MAQNVIIAEFVNTKSNNAQMLKVGVKTESGKCFKTMHFSEAIKALHYMFILQRNVHAKIDEESLALVRKAHEQYKAEHPKAEAAEQPAEATAPEVVEEPKVEKPARKARTKKAKAEGEKPARKSRAKKNNKKEAA